LAEYDFMTVITCIEDLRTLSRRRVPKMFYEYVDSGSWTESSYLANERDLAAILLRQRVGIDSFPRSTEAAVFGEKVRMPVALAPAGLTGMQHADGEILAARAAAQFGVPFVLSTMSICSIEEVAAATGAPFWFQLYLMRDRDIAIGLMERARAAQCPALVLTLDLPVMGQRHRDIRNGLSTPLRFNLKTFLDLIAKPGWCMHMLGTHRRSFGNIAAYARTSNIHSLAEWTASQFNPSVSWKDVAWVRQQWPGKLILKGIMDPEDARRAADCGADALIVSNHGGRQLDGAGSSVRALKPVMDAVADRLDVHFDGGIRSGQDVLRVLSMGAKLAYIGRPYLYGLGALGEKGVHRCLEIIHKELDLTMAFCGLQRIADANRGILQPHDFESHRFEESMGTGFERSIQRN
jgi:L-lactate dehydrogenase (cytochrome)